MNWCRLWHDLPNDPKFRTIARISESRTADVISVYIHLLVEASANATERGRTQPNAEDLASALDLQTERVTAILAAMQGRVLDGDYLSGWAKRQPKREDGSSDRSRKWREQHKLDDPPHKPNATERNRTQKNAPDETRRDETRRETVVVISPLSHTSTESVGRVVDANSSGNGTGGYSPDGPSDRPPNQSHDSKANGHKPEHVTNGKITEMSNLLHATMQNPLPDRPPRIRKPPDRDIVIRCLKAANGVPMDSVARLLRSLQQNMKIPEHGPRKYAWFESVIAEEFGGRV